MSPFLRIASQFRLRLAPAGHARLDVVPPYVRPPRLWLLSLRKVLAVAGFALVCFVWGMGFGLTAPALILFFAAPIPILGAIAIWAMPEAKVAPTPSLARLTFAYIGCMLLWPSYIALALPGLPWITMTRLTGVPLLVVLAICIASSAEFRQSLGASLKSSKVVANLFLGYLGFALLSVFLSKQPIGSLNQFFNMQIGATAFFIGGAYLFLTPGRATRMVGWLWFCAVAVGVMAVFEFRLQRPIWAGHVPSFLKIEDPSVERVLAGVSRLGVYRVAGTFNVSLGLAEFISLILPFIIHFMIGPFRASTRMAAAASIPFLLGVVYLTGARLGMVGCFLAIVLSGLIRGLQTWRHQPRSYLAPVTVLSIAGLTGLVIAAATFVGRVHSLVNGGAAGQMSNDGRKVQWAMGLPKVWARPWGYGLGNSGEVVGYAPAGFYTLDSDYLSKLIEFGILGSLIYYAIFLVSAFNAGRATLGAPPQSGETDLLAPLTASMVINFILKSVFASAADDPIIFMFLGMIIALRYRASGASSVAASPVRPR